MFKETHPILGTRDIQRAIEFYTRQLGFELAFGDDADPPNYVGFRRDAVEREFALYDLDRNALTFYRDLTSAEKGRHSS